MPPRQPPTFDTTKFINPSQIGGIDAYTIDEGSGRGVRALMVNTGGGLRYRILVDRGMDIDQAFVNQHSLTFLSHKGVTPPTRALDRGLDWLKGFPVGLLTSCGPFNIGGPGTDEDGEFGLHGEHSNTAACIESITQPDPHGNSREMSVVARIRYGSFYGPCVELKRRISSVLGENTIFFVDEFYNAGNTDVPHAWLLHINFGYPLLDFGAEFCYSEERVEPLPGNEAAAAHFVEGGLYKRIPDVLPDHVGPNSLVGYIYPVADKNGMTSVSVANPRLPLAVSIGYNVHDFPRCANWQHWGRYEYVGALEPSTGSVEGRDKDRPRGLLRTLKSGEKRIYRYMIDAITDKESIDALLALNRPKVKKGV
jgi:hypothetical protein